MPKLTIKQIQEIDSALEGAGVYYADIRMELTDHLASVMERDGFEGNISAYIQSHNDEIQELNNTAEAMAMRRNFRAAVAKMAKPGFWMVLAGLIGFGEALTYFTSADTAAMSTMCIALAIVLITAYNPVFKKHTPEFSGKKQYSIIERILVISSLGLLNYLVKTGQAHVAIAGYALIAATAYAFYASARKQVARYKSYYYA